MKAFLLELKQQNTIALSIIQSLHQINNFLEIGT